VTTDVHAALVKRFPSPEWVLLAEVRDDAGWRGSRSADAVAMNTWPSRGLQTHGVEIKHSRTDWLRELRDPAKSAAVQRYCDFWWLAVSDEKVAKLEEIPATWGFLILRGKTLYVAKPAPELKPEPPDRGFVAMLLRNATKSMTPTSMVDSLIQERVEVRLASEKDHNAYALEKVTAALDELTKRVVAFEQTSGISISNKHAWGDVSDPKKVGAVVKALLSGDGRLGPGSLQQAKNLVDGVSEGLQAALSAIAALRPVGSVDDEEENEEEAAE
jgi:hypothetical protein